MLTSSVRLSFAYILSLLTIVSCLQEERSPEDILIPSPAQVECSESAFSLTSKVPSGSEKLVDECGFLVGTTKDLADAVTVEGTLNANTFAADLPSRKYGTTYYICSYVTNGHGSEIRSDLRSFALEPLDKYVKFGDVTVRSYDLASKTAELALTADIWAGVEVSEAGLCYGKSEVLSIEGDHAAGTLADDGAIYITIKGFVDGDKYCLRPYLMDGEYLTYGAVVEFSIPAVPVVRTNDAAEVTSEGALLSGEVVKGADISERGFMLAEGESSAADMKQKKVVEGTIGEYTLVLEELLPNQKYTYCAYAVNPTGTYYGPVKSFTTKVGLPVVTSVVASSITSTSATLSATVKSHGGETVSEVGFYYSTDEAVDIETATKVNQPYSEASFDLQANELAANTKYYVKAYAVNSAGVGYSQIVDFTTSAGAPSVNTLAATDVTSIGATLSGTVIADNGAAIIERGFVWMQGTGTPTTDSFKLMVDGTTSDFTSTLDGLEPNQKYSFRAYAINSKGTAYGDVMTFTTVAGLPTLSAMKVSNITTTSATFTCAVTGHGGDIVSEVGFYIGKEESVDIETSLKISEAYTSDSFTLTATDLEVGTDYYVKAFTKNSVGETYSVIVSFKTISTAPSVTTVGSSEITDSSVLLSGEVTDDNGEAVTERGFVWLRGTGTPTTSNRKLRSDGTTGEYSSTLSALEPNQTYSFRSYAVNAKGTAYGETMTFRTEVALPEVVFVSCSDVTSSSAIVSGKVTSHGGETVSEVGFLYGTTSNLDSDTSSKVTAPYTGESFSITLTSLIRATEYYIQPFVINSAGTSYGDIGQFTTLPEPPVVSTSEVVNITELSAQSGGVVIDDGGGEILAKGVVWSRKGNPTIESSSKTNDGNNASSYMSSIVGLIPGTFYYVRAYATNAGGTSYGEQKQFITMGDHVELFDPANCFIVSEPGTYMFASVKGHSYESVGEVSVTEVLWESSSAGEALESGTLITSASSNYDKISFSTSDTFREGNALIAAKDANDNILWSWRIWLTDHPQDQLYINSNGEYNLLDRNLGATRADSGTSDEWKESIGVLYQWGRKDPFVGGIYKTNTTIDTIEESILHPDEHATLSIWYFQAHWEINHNNGLWNPKQKTIYDPCPKGYVVADVAAYNGLTINTDSFNNGYYISLNSSSDAWFPSTPIIWCGGSYIEVSDGVILWTSSRSNDNSFYRFHIKEEYRDTWKSKDNAAMTSPVRCMRLD